MQWVIYFYEPSLWRPTGRGAAWHGMAVYFPRRLVLSFGASCTRTSFLFFSLSASSSFVFFPCVIIITITVRVRMWPSRRHRVLFDRFHCAIPFSLSSFFRLALPVDNIL
jgi:hypothetical protein